MKNQQNKVHQPKAGDKWQSMYALADLYVYVWHAVYVYIDKYI